MIPGVNSALSGLIANSRKMRVSANNIANINTPAFKKEIDVTLGGSERSPALNTSQSAGSLVPTGNPFDVAIQGDGYFRVLTSDGKTGYIRQGALRKDSQGKLTDSSGNRLMPELTIPGNAKSFAVKEDGNIIAYLNGQEVQIGRLMLSRFNNPSALTPAGGGVFLESTASGQAVADYPGSGGTGLLVPGATETSNVDLAEEIVNMIMAKHGYTANTKTTKTADEMAGTILNIKA